MSDALPAPDRADGAPHPRETARLIGHAAAQAELLSAFRQGRQHQAWPITGPKADRIKLIGDEFIVAND